MNRNRRNALIAGSLLLLAANLAALGGVAWNRSGEAESKLVLSQRELQRNWSYGFWSEENSGVELRLSFARRTASRPMTSRPRCRPSRCAPSVSASRTRSTKRRTALPPPTGKTGATGPELDGPAYRREVRLAEERLAETRARSKALPRTKCCPARWRPLATN